MSNFVDFTTMTVSHSWLPFLLERTVSLWSTKRNFDPLCVHEQQSSNVPLLVATRQHILWLMSQIPFYFFLFFFFFFSEING